MGGTTSDHKTSRIRKTAAAVNGHRSYLVVRLQQPLVVGDVLHLVQEPAVDLGELVQLVHRVAGSEGRRQNEDALICGSLQLLVRQEQEV